MDGMMLRTSQDRIGNHSPLPTQHFPLPTQHLPEGYDMDAIELRAAWDRIGDLTPMHMDCGALCGAACCQADEDGQGGVMLFPGERELIEGCDWVEALDPVMVCTGRCHRELRPLGCRIFPLTPVRGKSGLWTVRLDARARVMCPLVSSGIRGLNPEFVSAVRDALRIVARDPEGEAFLEAWQAREDQWRAPLW